MSTSMKKTPRDTGRPVRTLRRLGLPGALMAFVCAGGALHAETLGFSDEFEREELGEDWTPVWGDWEIRSPGFLGGDAALEQVGVIEARPGEFDFSEPFKLEARLSPQDPGNSGFAGIAFHVLDVQNFLALRFRAAENRVQFYRLQAGSEGVEDGINEDLPFEVEAGEHYDVTVEMLSMGEYRFTISDGETDWVREASSTRFTRGNAGLYGYLGDTLADSFSVEAAGFPQAPSGVLADHFVREELGPDWNLMTPQWRLRGYVLGGEPLGGPGKAMLEYQPEGYSLDEPFRIEARLAVPKNVSSGFIGPAFNIQDVDNFFALRFRAAPDMRVQFYYQVDGEEGAEFTDALPFDITAGQFVDVAVEMTAPGEYAFSISDGENVWESSGSSDRFSGGTAGIYSGRRGNTMGLFYSLDLDPAAVDGYTAWAEANLPEGRRAPEDEPFGDGIANLVRYALGMAPVPSADLDRLPGAGFDGEAGTLEYAFSIRSDVDYIVQRSPDLVDWESVAPVVEEEEGGFLRVAASESVAERGRLFFRLLLHSE